jgi:RNA polymerase sigma factor (TIGR02999 family)
LPERRVCWPGVRQSMPVCSSQVITRLLVGWGRGDRAAFDQLVPLVYDELRQVAARRLRHERANHTLQPTALVHEAYVKLIDQNRVRWRNRAHFFAIASRLMRRILVDHARAHEAAKRGGGGPMVSLDDAGDMALERDVSLLALDDALAQLETLDSLQAQIIELRYFGGLTIEETAAAVRVSPATVGREWNVAKAWLYRELTR